MSTATVAGSAMWLAIFLIAVAAGIHLTTETKERRISVDVGRRFNVPPPLDQPARSSVSRRAATSKSPGRIAPVKAEPDLPDVPPNSENDPWEQSKKGDDGQPPNRPVIPPGPAAVVDTPVVYVEDLPEAIHQVQPEYPEIARDHGLEATVLVRALIGRDGRVREAFVPTKLSNPIFDTAAIDAVRRSTFAPARVNGLPVTVWIAIPIRFTLH
jgi:protein TonB